MTLDLPALVLLILDPRVDARTSLRGLAERLGVGTVRLAADMTEAFARLGDERVDAILLDHRAGPVALAFVRALRRQARGRVQETPVVIVVTADSGAIRDARDAGVTEVMAHPPTTAVLRERLEEVVLRPRRFIRSEGYVGPCRRRRRLALPGGPERRLTRPSSASPPIKA